jgi:hypothetical protein
MSENTNISLITTDNAHDVIKEVEDAFYDIPFENSAFQTENFVIAGQITPERAYRAIGLRMHKKLVAVQEVLIAREIEKVEEEELLSKIESPDYNKFEKRKFELELKKKNIYKAFDSKLLNDAIKELNVLYKHFKALPKYTREQFEAGERRHFLEDLNRQALGIDGAKSSLINMFDDIASIENFEKKFIEISNDYDTQKLIEFTQNNLTNVSKEKNKEKNNV